MKFKKELDARDLENLKALAQVGLPKAKICIILKISESTLDRMRKHRPEVEAAFTSGAAEGEALVWSAGHSMAISGKFPMHTQWWLKVMCGVRETQHVQITTGSSDISIDDMTRDERDKRINELQDLMIKIQGHNQKQLNEAKDVTPTESVPRGTYENHNDS